MLLCLDSELNGYTYMSGPSKCCHIHLFAPKSIPDFSILLSHRELYFRAPLFSCFLVYLANGRQMEVLGQNEEEDGVFLSHSLCWMASGQQLGLLHSFIPLKDCGPSFYQVTLASRLYFYHVLLCSSSWKSKVARLSLPFCTSVTVMGSTFP